MMTTRILTICAAVSAALAAGAAGTSLASAQGYPVPPGSVYSPGPPVYPPPGGPADYRSPRPMEYDVLDDDDGPNGPGSTRLPPPGATSPNGPRYGRPVYSDEAPITSPDDPRYGRPAGMPPAYTGPVMSPDDPRYNRPAGAPPVYSGPVLSPDDPRYNRPAPPAGAYSGPILSPDDPRYGRTGPPPVIYADRPAGDDGVRPPAAVGGSGYATGSVQPPQGQAPQGQAPQGPDNRSVSLLPPDEQPDAAPVNLPPNLRRQEVNFPTKEPAGTIVVDTPHTYLYYVLGNNRAIRYGVRVGRDGFTWTGVQKISRKAEWPDWHPPPEMIDRQPYLPRFMAGGPGNPLGARAMYLGNTVYRIHGTNQPSTIGKFVSSGCIGMLNDDVSDLYERAKVGTRVVVWPGSPPPGSATTASAAPVPGPNTASAAPPPSVPGTQPTAVAPLPPPVTVR